ncbi:MAG: hypothetical protein NT151_05165 [Acidobacteria bacterium]|nr:hypothetical protein [Acidobacteriota bacterium]
MSIATDLAALGQSLNAEVTDKKGVIKLEIVVAERKSFLSKKKLTYTIKCKPDDGSKELNYSEMLKESGFGVSSGSDDSEAGFGFKAGTYKTGFGSPTQGTIQEQSTLFGKQYTYSFDWSKIRGQVEDIARKNGYVPKYHVIMF